MLDLIHLLVQQKWVARYNQTHSLKACVHIFWPCSVYKYYRPRYGNKINVAWVYAMMSHWIMFFI